MKAPTAQRARRIWCEAIEAVVVRLGPATPPRVLDWYEEVCGLDVPPERVPAASDEERTPQGPRRGRVYSSNPNAVAKRRSRAKADVWEREREAAETRRRRDGVLPRQERLALTRARSEATRAEREERQKAKRKAYYAAHKEELMQRQRDRRAAMTLEERRAEWSRHQRAKRERDAAVRQLAACAEAAE